MFSKLFSNDSSPTEILIGADVIVAGLFTGINLRHMFIVLTAIETRYKCWIKFMYLGRFKPASTVNTITFITFDPLATQNAQSKLLLTKCRTTKILSQCVHPALTGRTGVMSIQLFILCVYFVKFCLHIV